MCGGVYTNISSLKFLEYLDIEGWFEHPVTRFKVYYIPEAYHMSKLARKMLANNFVLESDTG